MPSSSDLLILNNEHKSFTEDSQIILSSHTMPSSSDLLILNDECLQWPGRTGPIHSVSSDSWVRRQGPVQQGPTKKIKVYYDSWVRRQGPVQQGPTKKIKTGPLKTLAGNVTSIKKLVTFYKSTSYAKIMRDTKINNNTLVL
ncbi:unnamed protein product [Gordionus sp. m RMFG-2023]